MGSSLQACKITPGCGVKTFSISGVTQNTLLLREEGGDGDQLPGKKIFFNALGINFSLSALFNVCSSMIPAL